MKKKKEKLIPPDYYPWVTDFFDNHLISPKDRKLAEQLRTRHGEMKPVYIEIHEILSRLPLQKLIPERRAFPVMDAIIGGVARYGLNVTWSRKEIQSNINDINAEIVTTTLKLIALIDRHEKEQLKGPIISGAYLDIFHLIEHSTREGLRNPLFDSYIKPIIQRTGGFDTRYYPTLQEFLTSIISEIEDQGEPEPISHMDAVVLESQKPSRNDFIRYFNAVVKENIRVCCLPSEFSISHKAIATITECALGLETGSVDTSSVSKALLTKQKEYY